VASSKKPRNILVAEDEKPMSKALELKLTGSGYGVHVAQNGEEALEALASKELGPFDILLLDLVMPVKDGFEVLDELKKKKNKIPIIVLSNLGQEEDEDRVRELGAKEYFIKSNTSLAEIVTAIGNLLK
jgi:DNA-binding response OmpR family regulator